MNVLKRRVVRFIDVITRHDSLNSRYDSTETRFDESDHPQEQNNNHAQNSKRLLDGDVEGA